MSDDTKPCNCRTDIEERLLTRIKERFPDSKDHQVELGGYTFILGETLSLKPAMPIIGSHVTTAKSGKKTVKKIKENMIANFCPFCGQSLKKEDVKQDHAK